MLSPRLRIIVFAAGLLALPTAIHAQGTTCIEDGPHGGALEGVAGVCAELLISDRTITIHLYERVGEPVSSDGFTGSAIIGSGSRRAVVRLAGGPENILSGHAPGRITSDASITLMLNTPSGRKGEARF
jgi:hypothetical protein